MVARTNDTFATPYNQGYQDGMKAARERQKTIAALQIPVCYVGAPSVLESVAQDGSHSAILYRENRSKIGIPLYADPIAATQGHNTLSECEWKLLNSLDCTARWLESGGDVRQAIDELKLDVAMLRNVRTLAR